MMSLWSILRYKKPLLLIIIIFIITIRLSLYIYTGRTHDEKHSNKPRLAIIVPFRDRFDELLIFVPYMSRFLQEQDIGPFKIFVVNQSSKYRFNRGSLINVGYILAKNQSDYIAMHDVDLIPVNKNLTYSFPADGPYHLSSPEYHPKYNYSKYIGGILLISNEHFERVNGMSNKYYGWGLEDDEFYTRLKSANLVINRPTGLPTNRTNTFLHFHYERRRDTFKTKEQRDSLRMRDRVTGISNIRFQVTSSHQLMVDEHSCSVYNIELHCDTSQTPWCLKNYARKSTATLRLQ